MSYNPSSDMAKVTPAPKPAGPSKKWIRAETKAICDTSAGEVYIKGSPGKLMNAKQCQKACEDYPKCKSITFFKSGWCSLFSTACTKPGGLARSRRPMYRLLIAYSGERDASI